MMDATKYAPGYYPVPAGYDSWVKKDHIEKAPVFQGENLERREPVNSFYKAPVVPLSLLHGQVQPLCTIGQNGESLPL